MRGLCHLLHFFFTRRTNIILKLFRPLWFFLLSSSIGFGFDDVYLYLKVRKLLGCLNVFIVLDCDQIPFIHVSELELDVLWILAMANQLRGLDS